MPSEHRRAAANKTIGERHPYLTLYGGWIVGVVVVGGAGWALIRVSGRILAGWSPPSPWLLLPVGGLILVVAWLVHVWRDPYR